MNVEKGTVVVFGGSFDPISFTHIQVAIEALTFGFGDQVWLVPCGMRPDKPTKASPEDRLTMVSIALDNMVPNDLPIFVESTEVDQGRYIPTRELMCLYREKYPGLSFKLLMGDDLIGGLHTWDDFPQLITENKFIIYKRLGTADSPRFRVGDITLDMDSVRLFDKDRTVMKVERLCDSDGFHPVVSNISSTEVRKRLACKGPRSIYGLVPLPVVEFLIKNRLYQVADTS